MGAHDHTAFEDDTHKLWVQNAIRSDEAFKARMRELGYLSFPDMQAARLEAMREAYRQKVQARLGREAEASNRKFRRQMVKFEGNINTGGVKTERRIQIEDALDFAAERHGASEPEMVGTCRSRYVTLGRWAAFWVLRVKYGWALSDIGRRFKKDHTSVLHGVSKYAEIMEAGE